MSDHNMEPVALDSFVASNDMNATDALPKIEDKTLQNHESDQQSAPIKTASASAAAQLQDLTDRALRFLSNASNETLGACLIGLSATTYLVLGRVGLVLIGVVGGIALHATWEASLYGHGGKSTAQEKEANRKRELGLDVTRRVFAWRQENKAEEDELDSTSTQLVRPLSDKRLDFSAFQPETATALTAFTNAIIRDYVKYATSTIPFCGYADQLLADGGTPPSFLVTSPSPSPVDKSLWLFYFHYPLACHGNAQSMPSSIL